MLVASQADLDVVSRDGVAAVEWGSDIRTGDRRTSAGAAGAVAYTPHNSANGKGLMDAFVDPSRPRFQSGLPPVTVGSLTKMIVMRKAITEGKATLSAAIDYATVGNHQTGGGTMGSVLRLGACLAAGLWIHDRSLYLASPSVGLTHAEGRHFSAKWVWRAPASRLPRQPRAIHCA